LFTELLLTILFTELLLTNNSVIIVSIHLYIASCSAHQSEVFPVRETQREESLHYGMWLAGSGVLFQLIQRWLNLLRRKMPPQK